jgi:molybdopterin-containing oxidoreductase family membrane subunit
MPAALERGSIRIAACLFCIVGIWIEKGMGLIVPGFIPSTLHQIVEYSPSLIEWKVTAGIWAFGILVLTAALKMVNAILANPIHQPTSHSSLEEARAL